MSGGRISLGHFMGLAVIVAVTLAMFRGVAQLLTILFISAFLVMLDLALARLLIWRRPIRPSEYGFMVAGPVVTMLTLPFHNDPYLLRFLIRGYRDLTGDPKVFRFNNTVSYLYAERAALGFLILIIALSGAVLASRGGRWRRGRASGDHPV